MKAGQPLSENGQQVSGEDEHGIGSPTWRLDRTRQFDGLSACWRGSLLGALANALRQDSTMRRQLADFLDSDPIPLKEASQLVLRGVVSVSALREEIRRGNPVAMRIGKNLFTTPAAIREMMEKCRVQPVRPVTTSVPISASGSSATKERTDELAALKATVAALRSGSLK